MQCNDDSNKGSEDKDVNNDDNDNDDNNDAVAVASYLLWNCSKIYLSICCCPVNVHYNWAWSFVSCISFLNLECFCYWTGSFVLEFLFSSIPAYVSE